VYWDIPIDQEHLLSNFAPLIIKDFIPFVFEAVNLLKSNGVTSYPRINTLPDHDRVCNGIASYSVGPI
jgi:hypothetical protein